MENLNAGMVFLVFVAIVAFVIGVIARQWRKPARSAGLRVLSTLALGPRERLVEVLQGDEVLVLGVTSQHVQLIDRRQATDSERVIDSSREFSVANHLALTPRLLFC